MPPWMDDLTNGDEAKHYSIQSEPAQLLSKMSDMDKERKNGNQEV